MRSRGCAATAPRALLSLAVLAAPLFAAGCGGEDPDRAEVRSYLERVNAVQSSQKAVLVRADTVLRGYAERKPIGAPALAGVADGVRGVRAEVAAVKPPPAAREVHERLLKIYDIDAGLVAETERMVTYQDAAPAALAPLDRASAKLRRDLDRAKTAPSQARALKRFGASLTRVGKRLRALKAPALLQPAHAAQIKRLASTRKLSAQLETAVRKKDSRRVAKLLLHFRKNTTSKRAERRLTQRGIDLHTERLRELTAAQTELGRAQARLNRTFRPS
ncbi:hypothetical protein OJ997_15060 [Solirubrobacter phytolaccae]|uniref:Lipoprotein n=1 Tax=Solirubrobacter phytolaccae TaxID=1404360 RepID=A0A9X3S8L1_9ACTN|nr:hypothetical protein [Solirubrobacter phytolaccae]MDA0181623.1 hypothetical protein [Solirubrobacter phytolaccae]